MGVDDSFKKPGSVPFKWEIKPGVPKVQSSQQQQHKAKQPIPPPQTPPRKLRPPPAGLFYLPPATPEARSRSFRSGPRIRSERWRFDRPEIVSTGCFPANPLLKRKGSSRREAAESDCAAELETLARWSLSSRKSLLSSFRESSSSPSSSSNYSSPYQSSPRPVRDAEWAGFGLF